MLGNPSLKREITNSHEIISSFSVYAVPMLIYPRNNSSFIYRQQHQEVMEGEPILLQGDFGRLKDDILNLPNFY